MINISFLFDASHSQDLQYLLVCFHNKEMRMDTKNLIVIKEKLLSQRAELLERIERMRASRRREKGALSADFAEQAIEVENDEVIDSLDSNERQELQNIEMALQKIESGRYGFCEVGGEEIDLQRLLALPSAKTCIAHKRSS